MFSFAWLHGSRSARGTPPTRRTSRRPSIVLPVLTLVLLSQSGCQSGMFGGCGPFSDGPIRTWWRQRSWSLTRPDPCCGGGGVVSDVPMGGAAPAVIAPAPVGSSGVALPPPAEVSPRLEPVPSATPEPAPGGSSSSSSSSGTQGARSPTGKTNYEAARPSYGLGRIRSGLTRTYAQRTPSPTNRSAQGVAVASSAGMGTGSLYAPARAQEARQSAELSLLDNLPPLDLPREAARSDVKAASATATTPASETGALPENVPAPAPAEAASSTSETSGPSSPPLPVEVGVAPGLKRFAVVEPKLAGGSVPSSTGLDWLNEKGYKTLLDLRDPGTVPPTFLADVSQRGLRYISFPINPTNLNRDHLSRFAMEIALADARPLYFFDADGNRAGLLWYLHRMTLKNEDYDPDEAARQADEIGLSDDGLKKSAGAYLQRQKKASPAAPSQASAPTPASAPASPAPAPAVASAAADAPSSTVVKPATAAEPATLAPADEASAGPREERDVPAKPEVPAVPDAASLNMARHAEQAPPPSDPSAGRDPYAWRPLLALLLAALGVPVAYCSRSLIQFRGLLRASLPGPRRRPRSLPVGSGE